MPPSSHRADSRNWYRTPVARGFAEVQEPRVDREKGLLRGFIAMEKGIARGHNTEVDDETLNRIVTLTAGRRVKMRFGHPPMSDDAIGTSVARASNYRRDGDRVIADAQLLAAAATAPGGDLRAHILDLAEEAPDMFGTSFVIYQELEYRRDEKGEKMRDADGEPLPPLIRPTAVLASDFVDEPAATPSLFSGTNALLSAEAADQLAKILDRDDAEERLRAFAVRLSITHPGAIETMRAALTGEAAMADSPTPTTGDKPPDGKPPDGGVTNEAAIAHLRAAGFTIKAPSPPPETAPAKPQDDSVLAELRALRAELDAERKARLDAVEKAAKAERDALAAQFKARVEKLFHLGADDRKAVVEDAASLLEAGNAAGAERLIQRYERIPDPLSEALSAASVSVPIAGDGMRSVDLRRYVELAETEDGVTRVLRGDRDYMAAAAVANEAETPEARRKARIDAFAAARGLPRGGAA